MKAAELRSKDAKQLEELLLELLREQFNLRMQKGTGQLANPGRMKLVRRDIARVRMVQHELAAGNKS